MSEFVFSGITKPEERPNLFDETEKDIASSMYVTIGYECTLSTTKCLATPKCILQRATTTTLLGCICLRTTHDRLVVVQSGTLHKSSSEAPERQQLNSSLDNGAE